ncbi:MULTISPECIES: H-NS family nucleoid-associated regulatory protein [Enterobacteriaceae]|nr:H-NS family nucleoid-associated regulatory protein [Salmonella enterica]MDD8151378.1 H-NS histone family protein [Escherichia coli]
MQQCRPAKYRDPRNAENTWSGTGRRPTWLKELLDSGLSLDDLKI